MIYKMSAPELDSLGSSSGGCLRVTVTRAIGLTLTRQANELERFLSSENKSTCVEAESRFRETFILVDEGVMLVITLFASLSTRTGLEVMCKRQTINTKFETLMCFWLVLVPCLENVALEQCAGCASTIWSSLM